MRSGCIVRNIFTGDNMKNILDILKKIYGAQTGYGKWCVIAIIAVFGIIGGTAAMVLTVDPFYRYHEPFFYKKVYYELYYTAPSLLRNEKYDLLMLGTSMTRNFFLSDINETFDCDAIKFAASGGTTQDLRKFFDVAKDAKKDSLKRVVISLDIYSMNKPDPRYEEADFMYDKGLRQEYRYFFSRKTFSSMFYLIKRAMRPKRARIHQVDRNRMFSTDYDGKPYGLREVLKDTYNNRRIHHTQTPYNKPVYENSLSNALLPMIDENPGIQFTIYLPPYHIYTYCMSEQFKEADPLIRQKSEVMKELLKRKNVTLHDFQSDPDYVCTHEFFCDVQHFSNTAARRVLADLVTGKNLVKTEQDVEEKERALRALIQKMMPQYNEHMQNYRKK